MKQYHTNSKDRKSISGWQLGCTLKNDQDFDWQRGREYSGGKGKAGDTEVKKVKDVTQWRYIRYKQIVKHFKSELMERRNTIEMVVKRLM